MTSEAADSHPAKTRVIVAGAGLFGREHLQRLAARSDVEIAGVAEPVVFDFTYVNPEDYSFVDLYVPGEKDRTINNSW